MKNTAKHSLKKSKVNRGLDPAIVENILWFSKFTPLEKIRYCEKQEKWFKWVKTFKPRGKTNAV